ncbi:MAG: YciI family protein [Anaerolineae bacterium]|nr:YciI family protein [Anaerolineae bacterium]
MQYMFLIYTDPQVAAAAPEAEMNATMAAYFAFDSEVRQKGIHVSGEGLHPPSAATTVRQEGGKLVTTDGPFAETKEFLGGYYILDCKDLDEAVEWAGKIPGVKYGSIEVRPVMVYTQE